MQLLKITVLSAALLAGGCATEMEWRRANGAPVVGWQFERDSAHCRHKAFHSDDPEGAMRRCMARKGYVWSAAYNDYGYGYGNGYDRGYRRHNAYDY
jgi:hypothetical protein